MVRAPAAIKAGDRTGFDSQWLTCAGFVLFQLAYTNADGMKDLWCSSTVSLATPPICPPPPPPPPRSYTYE